MKTQGGVQVELEEFLTSALDVPFTLFPRKDLRLPFGRRLSGFVSRSGLDSERK